MTISPNIPPFTLTYLHDRKILSVYGQETETFLQGLTTQDVKQLQHPPQKENEIPILWTAFLSPQGKYLFDAFIIKDLHTENLYYIDIEASALYDLGKFLQSRDLSHNIQFGTCDMYVFASQDLTEIPHHSYYAQDPRMTDMGYRLYTASPLHHASQDQNLYQAWRIKSAIPCHLDINSRGFILEYNFRELNGISLQKGCYTGQEVTTRMHYRDTIKYKLLPYCINAATNISHIVQKNIIYNGQNIGTTTNSHIHIQQNHHDITLGLALIQTKMYQDFLQHPSLHMTLENMNISLLLPPTSHKELKI